MLKTKRVQNVRTYITTRTVDVEVHRLIAVNTVQVEHGSYYLVTELLVNVLTKEYDSFTILQNIHHNISTNLQIRFLTDYE